MDQPELDFTEPKRVVRLQLSPELAKQLAPIAIDAARDHENVLFIAVTVPFWSVEDQTTLWEFQVASRR